MQIKYSSPNFFYPKQQSIYDCQSKYTVVLSSNKTGKTLALACWINERAILGESGTKYCWLAPYSKTSKIGYELVKKIIMGTKIYLHLKDINHKDQFKFNSSSPQKITYPNGNVIDFIQGQNIDAIFGEQYTDAVVDEATRLKQEIIEGENGEQIIICPAFKALETTMRITRGNIKLISNPTIKNNWYYIWYKKILAGKDERASAFHLSALDSIEAGFLLQEDFDYAETHESSYIFKRDWMGEVPEVENSVFRSDKIYENIDDTIHENLSKVVFLGIDLGFTINSKSDWTVVTGINKSNQIVFFKRFRAEGQELINKLSSYINNRKAYIDATSGGGITIYNLLKTKCKNLEAFTFNNKNKCSTIETLAHFIHTNKISYPNNEILINELLGYESETSSTGLVTYNNGKSISYDDAVISLALCVLSMKEKEDDGPDYSFEVTCLDEEEDKGERQWTSVGSLDDFNNFDYGNIL